MSPSLVVHSEVDAAIERAQSALLAAQAPDGHWVGELEADSTITSEYLLLGHLLDRVDRDREAKMVTYLRERQLADGGWSLYEGGPANLSATIKAYFAMRMDMEGEKPSPKAIQVMEDALEKMQEIERTPGVTYGLNPETGRRYNIDAFVLEMRWRVTNRARAQEEDKRILEEARKIADVANR